MASQQSQISFLPPATLTEISSSPELVQALYPQGPGVSPYEILDYDATLTIHDARGRDATLSRVQWMRFLQDDVAAILDHTWGEGKLLASYDNTAGPVVQTFHDGNTTHLAVALLTKMKRGEMAPLRVTHRVENAFPADHEWVETNVDHPVRGLRRRIIFPKRRPCRRATLQAGEWKIELPVLTMLDGRAMVRFDVEKPISGTPFTVRWLW